MNFLDQVYLDNSIRSYVAVAITILLALLLKRIISKYAISLIFKLGKSQWGGMDRKRLDSIIISPFERILVVIISIFALDRLNFPKAFVFSVHKVTSQDIVGAFASAIIIICVVSLILRFMDFLMQVIKHRSKEHTSASEHQLLFFFISSYACASKADSLNRACDVFYFHHIACFKRFIKKYDKGSDEVFEAFPCG
jgi:MscS family membrane protein